MTDLQRYGRSDQGILMPGQTLTENWSVEYSRRDLSGPVEARLSWPHPVHYLVAGQGPTVEAARLDLVLKLAGEVARDPDPHRTDPEAREAFEEAVEAAKAAMGGPETGGLGDG